MNGFNFHQIFLSIYLRSQWFLSLRVCESPPAHFTRSPLSSPAPDTSSIMTQEHHVGLGLLAFNFGVSCICAPMGNPCSPFVLCFAGTSPRGGMHPFLLCRALPSTEMQPRVPTPPQPQLRQECCCCSFRVMLLVSCRIPLLIYEFRSEVNFQTDGSSYHSAADFY